MDKKDIVISSAMTALIAAFMVIAPKFIMGSRASLTQQYPRERRETYQGIIRIWHIAGFKPYRGSLGVRLSRCAAKAEKRHTGVYFEVESLAPGEWEAKSARGEKADVYSFPAGWFYPEELAPIEWPEQLPALRGNMAGAGVYGGALYAVPYCASGYVLTANMRFMQEKGIAEKDLPDIIRSGGEPAAGNPVIACLYGAERLGEDAGFADGRCCAAFMDAGAAGELDRKLQGGRGFPYAPYPCGNFSDLVQFMGLAYGIDDAKAGYALEFMASMLGLEEQAGLGELGLMPALKDADMGKAEGTAETLRGSLCGIAVPNTFLYRTYREQLEISARSALEGSAAAKKDFDLRVIELVRGAAIK